MEDRPRKWIMWLEDSHRKGAYEGTGMYAEIKLSGAGCFLFFFGSRSRNRRTTTRPYVNALGERLEEYVYSPLTPTALE